MIRFISAEDTLALRSVVLRDGAPYENCIFPTDNIEGAFHLGGFIDNDLVVVASFFPNNHPEHPGNGYQLRGMATNPLHAGKGMASQLISFAVTQLNATTAQYLWCNARVSAIGFYEKSDFELISEIFEIEGVGPHRAMLRELRKAKG